MDALERIAEAVLYEGYLLWPYRRSARKNQQRWTFGGIYPRGFCEATRAGDAWQIQTQCLIIGQVPMVDVELRFLQCVERRIARESDDGALVEVDELTVGNARIVAWDEAVERRVSLPANVSVAADESRETVPGGVVVRRWETLSGGGVVNLDLVADDVWRVSVVFENTSGWLGTDRLAAQRRAFLSAHLVLHVQAGAFVSATDPPADLASLAHACQNVGVWPVLVGNDGEQHTILASPIILYDYPQVAPESPQLWFDSGEIDQLLLLNTLTLTDAEKAEVRATDSRAREILDRAETLSVQDFTQLHGAIREFRRLDSADAAVRVPPPSLLALERRTPTVVFVAGAAVSIGSRVRLRPRQAGDIFDLALAGQIATVESIEQDYDERVHLAVTVDEDPGRDLGALRLPGHRFFFSPEEVEPLG